VYGGSGCEEAHREVLAVADKLKAPIAHTSRAKDFLEHDNPYNIGMTGMLGNEAGFHALLNCDALLMLGADFAWRQFYPDNAKIVQVDIDPTHLGRRHPVTKGVVGDVKATLEALLPRLSERSDGSFRNGYLKRYAKYKESEKTRIAAGHDGSIPGSYLTKVISEHAPKDALFTADDGTPAAWAYRHIEANGQRRIFASLLHGTMANAMPGSIGLQKAEPNRQVICLAGDGGLAMLFGDLMTIVQHDLPIKIAVYDNGKLGFVEIEQLAEGMLDTFTRLKNPNFAAVARALGFWGQTVSKADELEGAVKDWLAQPGPALLHVHVNPMQLVIPPFMAVEPAIGMALYSTRAILHGRGGDVWEMVKENFI
jgi:pyruvate dehydrogenase (quinone)